MKDSMGIKRFHPNTIVRIILKPLYTFYVGTL